MQTATITRSSYTEGDYKTLQEYIDADAKKPADKKRTIGNKKFIPYGLYVMKVSVSANLSKVTGFSEKDLEVLLQGIAAMYQDDISASKMGMSLAGPIIVFKHIGTQADKNSDQNKREARLGCARADKLFGLLKVQKKTGVQYPRSIEDYDIRFDADKLPDGVICGFKNEIFDSVDWSMKDADGFFTKE